MPRPTKVCPQCGGTFRKRSDQSADSWAAQVHCSRWCAGQQRAEALAAQRLAESKCCVECGRTLIRPSGLTDWAWERRRFCSQRCRNAFHHRSADHLCACGQPPTTTVYFQNITADGYIVPGELSVCADCAAFMLENDPGCSATPFPASPGGRPHSHSTRPAVDTMPHARLRLRAYTR